MDKVQQILTSPIETIKSTVGTMATTNDTSFAAHTAHQFTSYEKDRQMNAQQTTYASANGAPQAHAYESQRAGENGPLLLQDFHLIDLLYVSHS
jgi:catalase